MSGAQHPLPAGVHDTFTYACNACGGTISVVGSTRQSHACIHGPEVRAWDTEYGDYVAWGTHSPSAARAAVRNYLREVVGEPQELLDDSTPPFKDFQDATRYWADPKVLENEGQWDESEFHRDEVGYTPFDGWVPYMVITQ